MPNHQQVAIHGTTTIGSAPAYQSNGLIGLPSTGSKSARSPYAPSHAADTSSVAVSTGSQRSPVSESGRTSAHSQQARETPAAEGRQLEALDAGRPRRRMARRQQQSLGDAPAAVRDGVEGRTCARAPQRDVRGGGADRVAAR